jgi:hypothetical protein
VLIHTTTLQRNVRSAELEQVFDAVEGVLRASTSRV